jgi:hypothetical protein
MTSLVQVWPYMADAHFAMHTVANPNLGRFNAVFSFKHIIKICALLVAGPKCLPQQP